MIGRLFGWIFGLIGAILLQVKILYHMLLSPISGATHQERLESFYKHQASGYDSFRKKLLHGREYLSKSTPKFKNAIWIDMGGGTGINVQNMADEGRLGEFSKVYIVDFSPSLLSVARQRIQENGWKNVEAVEADATLFVPPEGPNSVDFVSFTYSLTMIPDWFIALENAKKLLKPKGLLGVVDFYVARKYPAPGMVSHSWLTRTFWPVWFAHDNVNLNADQLPMLKHLFKTETSLEMMGPAPIITFVKIPYHIFIGSKREQKN